MRADKNNVLLLCEEIAYFLFNILHLLLTQIVPLIGLVVGSLLLQLFRLSRSLVSSGNRVSSRNHAARRSAQTAGSTNREAAEPLAVYKDALQDDLDSVDDDWIGVQEDFLVHAAVNEQELQREPAPNLLRGKQGKEHEKERSERDYTDDSGIAMRGLLGGADSAAEAGGQDTQNVDGNGELQEAEQGDGNSGALMVVPVKLPNTGEAAIINMKKEPQLGGFVQRMMGASRLEDDEGKDEYSPPWLRSQRSLQSPSDLPPDLDGVIVAAAVNNEGKAVAGLRPLAPTFSTIAAQLRPRNERSAASDRPAATAGESEQTNRRP